MRARAQIRLLVAILLLSKASLGSGQTLHVATTGSDSNDGSASLPFRTIHAALDLVQPGDTVKIASGAYAENITTNNVVLLGGYDVSFAKSARNIHTNKTILNPNSGTIIAENGGSVIDGLFIDGRNGASDGIEVLAGNSVITHNAVFGFFASFATGIRVYNGASASIINNTVMNNRLSGGGIIIYSFYIQGNLGNATTIRNNIIVNNDVGLYISVAGVTANYNCVFNNDFNYDGPNSGEGANDVAQAPAVVNAVSGDFRLKSSSPCLNAGDPADDFSPEPMPNGGRIDMGVYGGTAQATTISFNPTTHVSKLGSDSNDGSAASPLLTLQHAISNAAGDTIKVAGGTYNGGVSTNNQIVLRGGYGEDFRESTRDIFANMTTINAVSTTTINDEFGSTIDGFVIDANGVQSATAIRVNNGSTVSHCIVRRADDNGISAFGGANIHNNTILDCTTGIEINSGSGTPSVRNNILSGHAFAFQTLTYSAAVRPYNCVFGNTFNYVGENLPGTGDISLDPEFLDKPNLDLRLLKSSPCVDAGDPTTNTGTEPSPYQARVDMGAYGGTVHSPYILDTPEPTDQPTALSVSAVTTTSITISFSAATGDPDGYLVLRKQGASPSALPEDETAYTSGEVFGDAVVAYSGPATGGQVIFTDAPLVTAAIYYYAVFSFNGAGPTANYRIEEPLTGDASTLTTEPTAQPTVLKFKTIGQVSATVSFTAAANVDGYLVVRKSGSYPSGDPVDGLEYAIDQALGDGVVAYAGADVSFQDVGLSSSTAYYYKVYAYRGDGGTRNYRTASPLQGFFTTRAGPALPIHVSTAGSDSNDGSVGAPLRNIQTAINMALSGDTIKVSAGIYTQSIILADLAIIGGFDNSFTWSARDLVKNKTIIKPFSGTAVNDAGGSFIDGFILDGRNGASRGIHLTAGISTYEHNVVYGFNISGGGIAVGANAAARIINNTITHNRLSGGGTIISGLHIEGNFQNATVIRNNIVARNDVGIYISAPGVASDYNCIFTNQYGNYSGINGFLGDHDIELDPVIVNPANLDFRLKGSSPCIDAGDPNDPVGQERSPNGGRIDMGAYGGTASATPDGYNPIIHVSKSGADSNDGSATAPLLTIQQAINSTLGDSIKVAVGTYAEAVVTGSKVVLIGGYANDFATSTRDIFSSPTILEGVSAVMINDAYGSTIDGFVLDGKNVPSEAGVKGSFGTIVQHSIVRNITSSFASAIEGNGGTQIVNNTIVGCHRAIELNAGTGAPVVRNNIIANNTYGITLNAFNASTRSYNDLHGNIFNYTGVDSNAGTGELTQNPKFVDVSNGDFRVLDTSPCVNAGDPTDPVGQEPEPNGGRIDMGSYGGTPHTPYRDNIAEPQAQPTNLVFTNVTSSSFDASFNAATGDPAGYLVIRKAGSQPTSAPDDGTSYTAGTGIGDAIVVYVGSQTSFQQTGLASASNFHFAVFAFNGTGAVSDYLITSPLRATVTTLAPEPTEQPGSFNPTAVTESGATISYSDPVGAGSGFLAIRKAGSGPSIHPTDGTEYTKSEAIGDGIVAYSGSALSFNENELVASTTYHYRIYHYNGSGNTRNYLTVNPLTGNFTTLSGPPDTTPPIVASNQTPASVAPGSPLNVSANFTDAGSGVNSVKIQYRSVAAVAPNEFETVDMPNTSGSTYAYSIPANVVSELGVEYKFLLEDEAGNNNAQSQTLYHTAVRHASGLSIPYESPGRDVTNYRIIAVPLDLDQKSLNAVIGDELGDYDPVVWTMYRWEGGPQFEELSGNTQMVPGKGYWLLTPVSTSLNSGAGTTVESTVDDPFTIVLDPGWNQIGNPYPFDVYWPDVLAANLDHETDLGANSKVRVFRGTAQNVDELHSFEGGFIKNTNDQSISIKIPPAKNPSINGRKKDPAPGRKQSPGDRIWEVMFSLQVGDYTYSLGGIGMHPEASEGFDKFDDFNWPRFIEYAEIRFPGTKAGMTYTKDVVPTNDSFIWNFSVETNIGSEYGLISWDNTDFRETPAMYLLDRKTREATNMRTQNRFHFRNEGSRDFSVIMGTPDFIQAQLVPEMLTVHDPYPNPFSDRITLPFAVPDIDNRNIRLEIFDNLGRAIVTSIILPPAGPNTLTLDIPGGRGVYHVRLTMKDQTVTKRITKK